VSVLRFVFLLIFFNRPIIACYLTNAKVATNGTDNLNKHEQTIGGYSTIPILCPRLGAE